MSISRRLSRQRRLELRRRRKKQRAAEVAKRLLGKRPRVLGSWKLPDDVDLVLFDGNPMPNCRCTIAVKP